MQWKRKDGRTDLPIMPGDVLVAEDGTEAVALSLEQATDAFAPMDVSLDGRMLKVGPLPSKEEMLRRAADLKSRVAIEEIADRLKPDGCRLLVEGVRSLNGVYDKDHAAGWIGYIHWHDAAKRIGMPPRLADAKARKFAKLGLQEDRNHYDGWLLRRGLEVAEWLIAQGR